MAVIKYDGSAQDTHTIPQVLKRGDNGKPLRGKVITPARVQRRALDEYNLRGLIMPKGVALVVEDADIIQKATTLGCFEVVVAEDEAVCEDKDWLRWAKQKRRIKMVKTESELPDAGKANEAEVLATVVHDDGLDDMKYHELKRLAAERELSVPPGTKKVEIIKLIREVDGQRHDPEESAGGEDQGPSLDEDMDFDGMQDVG